MIPLYDLSGVLSAVQLISNEGVKKFPGMPMKGYFHVLGDLKEAKEAYVTEGYATGLSVHLATKKAVIVAFSSNLVCIVGKSIQNSYPNIFLTLASDKGASGEKSAKDWQEYISSDVAFPEEENDFNDVLVREGLESVKNQLVCSKALSSKGRDLLEFLSMEMPDVVFLNQYIMKGSFNVLYGAGGSGKSRYVMSLAWAFATGSSFDDMDHKEKHRVLYVDGELPAPQLKSRFKEPLTAFKGSVYEPGYITVFDDRFLEEQLGSQCDLYLPQHLKRLIKHFQEYDVIILDNFNNLHLDPKSDSFRLDRNAWTEMFQAFKRLKTLGVTVIMLMHTTKAGSLEGVGKIWGDCDTIIQIEPPLCPDSSMAFHAKRTIRKGREVPEYKKTPTDLKITKSGQWDIKHGY